MFSAGRNPGLLCPQIADNYEDLATSTVMDLGCGTVRSLSTLLVRCPFFSCITFSVTAGHAQRCVRSLGLPLVLGVDVDSAALKQAGENISSFPGLPVELLQADVCQLGRQNQKAKSTEHQSMEDEGWPIPFSSCPVVDCVIMNPPFGSWQKGADSTFLAAAVQVPPLSAQHVLEMSHVFHVFSLWHLICAV